MSTKEKVAEFLLSCVDQTRSVTGNSDLTSVHHLMILELCSKIFELEDRIKGLENE